MHSFQSQITTWINSSEFEQASNSRFLIDFEPFESIENVPLLIIQIERNYLTLRPLVFLFSYPDANIISWPDLHLLTLSSYISFNITDFDQSTLI